MKWIREGMARNPDSHYGTEWLHALFILFLIYAYKRKWFFLSSRDYQKYKREQRQVKL